MARTPTTKVPVKCNECGKAWKVSPNAVTLQCSRCNSVDIDVKEDEPIRRAS